MVKTCACSFADVMFHGHLAVKEYAEVANDFGATDYWSQTWSDRELDGIFSRLVREPNQINSVFDGLSCNRNEA